MLHDDVKNVLGDQQFSTVSLIAAEVDQGIESRIKALQIVAQGISQTHIDKKASLQELLENRPVLHSLFNDGVACAGLDGTVLADFPQVRGRVGANFMERDYIIGPLKEGKITIGKPVRSKLTQNPSFVIAVPVKDTQGKVIGVLAGVINLGKSNFLDNISGSRYGKTGGYLIVAPQHQLIVTASDKRRVMEALPSPGTSSWIDRISQGYEGTTIFVNPFGVEVLTSVKSIPISGWLMVAALPTEEAFAVIQSMQKHMFLGALALTLIAGILTWWSLMHQLSPMLAAAKTIAALSDTEQHPQPLPITSQDEIGDLIGGFNRLLETLGRRERALNESEQNLAITLHSIGDAVIATDVAGRIVRMNATAERLTGWTLVEARERLLPEIFHIINATTRSAVGNPVASVLESGHVVGLANHTVLVARDGREYQIADSAAPIRDAAGKIVGVVLVFSDVTEKYRAEEALRESEERYRFINDASLDQIYSYDLASRFTSANRVLCANLGRRADEVIGKTYWELGFPESQCREWDELHRQVYATGSRVAVVSTPMPDGTVHFYEVNLSLVHDSAGAIIGIAGVNRDITEKYLTDQALRESEERWKFAIEGAGDGLWDWNIVTGKAFYSLRYKTMLGFAEDEIGNTADEWTKRIHPEDAPGVFSALQPYMEGKLGSATVEFRLLCKDGSWIWTLGRGMVVERNADGKPLRMIGTNTDITERKEHQNQLEYIAHFDALTNLPNRVLLADRLQQSMAQAPRRGQQLAVVYLDLDGFKAINDLHGHGTGDQVLVILTQRMKESLREGDTLARLGGDEFVAVLVDMEDTSACLPLVTRLLAAASQPMEVGELDLQVSASVGITFYPQLQDVDADQLLRQADNAMYQAKVAGKNRYYIFDAEQDSSIRGHHESLERIRVALQQREFVLYFQPKVHMRSGAGIGAEALIRWQHPEKGLLAPAAFLPVIEDHPLAVAVGEWVIDTALTQIELWHAVGLEMPVSVNVGARQLQQSNFVTRLQAILAAHPQIDPSSLELEVLETSALGDIAQVSQVIGACAEIAVMFALDDFGTGYSSLTYLKRLGVTLLKIDQSFVRDMLDDPDDLAILQAIIGLAKAFKRQVIAEGVETVAHGTLLLQLGCELAQGYGIARPMPAEQLPAWVSVWKPDPAWSARPSQENRF
jgi:diguanylate cyclase (GGDEF)-like protein/PAS domain S-box-containing protein